MSQATVRRRNRRSQDPLDRFWPKVQKTESCWLWIGGMGRGYGRFGVDSHHPMNAHRAAYLMFVGQIPDGLSVDHICRVTRCVRPDHLRLVDHKQNAEHMASERTQTRSGIRGVNWSDNGRCWRVRVKHNGREYSGGMHANLEDAEAAAIALRLSLFTHNELDKQSARLKG